MNRITLSMVILLSTIMLQGCTYPYKTGDESMTGKMTTIIDNNGADPWVIKQGSNYYYMKTTGNNVTLFRSKELSNVAAGEQTIVFEENAELSNFWAPEIHYLDESWYIYFAASKTGSNIHQMFVLVNDNDDPMEGTWSCLELKGMDDKFAIDGTILETPKGRYFIWSGWEGYENIRQDLYIARMVSPIEVVQEKVLISKPEYDWEKNGEPLINEGPQIVIRKNMINLMYSASGSWTNDYCLGLLTASLDSDPMNPEVWRKEKDPVFMSGNGIYGPGHNSFTLSPDNTEEYMVYHSARWDGSGWNRLVRLQKIEFDREGKFIPRIPNGSEDPIDIPKGEQERYSFGAGQFQFTKGLKKIKVKDVMGQTVINGFEDVSEQISLKVDMTEEGQFSIFIYGKLENFYDENYIVPLAIEVNGESYEKIMYPSEYFQPLSLNVQLKEGINEITLRSVIGGDEISMNRIEIMPKK